jgi:exonuclease III
VHADGDFNLSRNYDTARRRLRSHPDSHTAFLEDELVGLESLTDCHRRHNSCERQSFYSTRTNGEYQDDHLFVSPELARYSADCEALDWPEDLRHLSDHAPLVSGFSFR